MKNLKYVPTVLCFVFVLACLQLSVSGQSTEERVASVISGGSSVRWNVSVAHSGMTLTVTGPDGFAYQKQLEAGATPEFKLVGSKGERLSDGVYTYELRLSPVFAPGVKESLAAARTKGNDDEVQRDLVKRGLLPKALVQSGSFVVMNGTAITAGATEVGAKIASVT